MAMAPDRESRKEKESKTTQGTSRLEEGVEEEKGEEEGWRCPSGRADIHTAAHGEPTAEQVGIS